MCDRVYTRLLLNVLRRGSICLTRLGLVGGLLVTMALVGVRSVDTRIQCIGPVDFGWNRRDMLRLMHLAWLGVIVLLKLTWPLLFLVGDGT